MIGGGTRKDTGDVIYAKWGRTVQPCVAPPLPTDPKQVNPFIAINHFELSVVCVGSLIQCWHFYEEGVASKRRVQESQWSHPSKHNADIAQDNKPLLIRFVGVSID